MTKKINLYEKFGDFLLHLTQLIIGGIIFAAIMTDKTINSAVLYSSALFAVIVLLLITFALYKINNKNKERE